MATDAAVEKQPYRAEAGTGFTVLRNGGDRSRGKAVGELEAIRVCQTKSMGVRFAAVAAPAVLAALILLAGPAACPAQAPSPPMFSPWYAESLRDILKLEGSDVARLEQRLAANPEDFPTRLKLMAYHQRADRANLKEDRAQRAQHALWLIEHHPESEILHSPVSRFSPGELTPADYRRAVALWDAAAKAKPGNAAVGWNAASFFQDLDPELYMRYLESPPQQPIQRRPSVRPASASGSLCPLAAGGKTEQLAAHHSSRAGPGGIKERMGARQRCLHASEPIQSESPKGCGELACRGTGRTLFPECQGPRSKTRPADYPATD